MASKKKSFYEKWRTDKKYTESIEKLPCCGCGNNWDDICAHHQRGDGTVYGTGTKAPDWQTIPLCNSCHYDIHNQNMLGLRNKQESLILISRKQLIKGGFINEGEYPKEKDYV